MRGAVRARGSRLTRPFSQGSVHSQGEVFDMAKSAHPTSGMLALLDAAERRIFDASRGGSLAAATKAQLGTLVAQARALRDKWRDQFRGQRRTSQRAAAARGVGGNDRSRQKGELFADAVTRIEKRLAELGGSVAKAVTAAKGGAGPSKAARSRSHRATRAATRAALAELVAGTVGRPPAARPGGAKAAASGGVKTNAGGVVRQGKVGAKASAGRATGAMAGQAGATAKAGATGTTAAIVPATDVAVEKLPTPRAGTASKKRLTGRPATVAAAKATSKHKSQVLAALPAAQVRAAAKLKASRVRMAGLDTRLRGHTTAQGRRRQGRRDGRGT